MSEHLVDIHNMAPEVCHTPESEKKQAKSFSSLETLRFFSQNMCFQQPLRCYRKDLVTSTATVKTACGYS